MTISRITSQDAVGTTSASYPVAPTAGHLLLCATFGELNASLTGWTKVNEVEYSTAAPGFWATLFSRAADGTEGTVTPTTSGGFISVTSICEYSGASATQDGTSATSANSATVSSLATAGITTTNANDLIFTIGIEGSGHAISWATATLILATNAYFVCGERIVSTTQSGASDTASWSPAGTNNATIIAAFKASAAPAYVPPAAHRSFVPQMRASNW